MLILVFGLPGTGKTFFSDWLSTELNAIYLNTDIIRTEKGFRGKYDKKTKHLVYEILAKETEKHLRAGSDVIVDGTFHKLERRKMMSEIANETGHNMYMIEIKASEETVKKRIKKKRKYSEAGYEIYKKIKEENETPDPAAHLVLWSDKESIDKMIIKAKNYIGGYQSDKTANRK